MPAVNAIWKGGQIILDQQVDWPEGCELRIEPQSPALIAGMTEEQQADDPESVARWIAEFNSIPAISMSAEDEADMRVWRQTVKEYTIDAVRREMGEAPH
jgi:hypothetical protein